MLWHSTECEAVLARCGLANCPMTIIGADKRGQPPRWGVTVICRTRSHFLDIRHARELSANLTRINESRFAERLPRAAEVAMNQAGSSE